MSEGDWDEDEDEAEEDEEDDEEDEVKVEEEPTKETKGVEEDPMVAAAVVWARAACGPERRRGAGVLISSALTALSSAATADIALASPAAAAATTAVAPSCLPGGR